MVRYRFNVLSLKTPVTEQISARQISFFFPLLFLVDQRPLFCIYSPLPPLRGQPTVEYHPRWQVIQGLAVHCRLGRLPDLNPGLQAYSLVLLPMSHHCFPMSHHCFPARQS
jgi:hypothetical protein